MVVGTTTIAGVLSASEPIDVAGLAGTLGITGALAATEAPDLAALSEAPPVVGNPLVPWTYQADACRQGPIVTEGRRQSFALDVVFDPVKAEIS